MIHWGNIMNTNEVIQSRNDNQTRMKPYNDSFMHNVYPFTMGLQPLMYNYSPQIVLNTNGGFPVVNNSIESSSDQSGIVSPNIDANADKPLFRLMTWSEISEKYEGIEQRPRCGRLNNNVYFTQRATSSDVYMLFEKKSDYINHFVNYYFSDKNLARDTKLVALMDDKGIIPLSALVQFPKLQQIDSSIEDLIKAFQTNSIVMSVDKNGEKGAQRRDKWCPSITHKIDIEKHTETAIDNLGGNLTSEQTLIQNDNMPPQNQHYIYINPMLQPSMYTQPHTIMTNTPGLAPYSPYAFLPFQNHATNQSGINTQPNPATLIWQIPQHEYGNQNLMQQMPINRYATPNSEAPSNRLI